MHPWCNVIIEPDYPLILITLIDQSSDYNITSINIYNFTIGQFWSDKRIKREDEKKIGDYLSKFCTVSFVEIVRNDGYGKILSPVGHEFFTSKRKRWTKFHYHWINRRSILVCSIASGIFALHANEKYLRLLVQPVYFFPSILFADGCLHETPKKEKKKEKKKRKKCIE